MGRTGREWPSGATPEGTRAVTLAAGPKWAWVEGTNSTNCLDVPKDMEETLYGDSVPAKTV